MSETLASTHLFLQQQKDGMYAIWVGEDGSKPPGWTNRYPTQEEALNDTAIDSHDVIGSFCLQELPGLVSDVAV